MDDAPTGHGAYYPNPDAIEFADLVRRLRHTFGVAVAAPSVFRVQVSAHKAQTLLPANPFRLYAAVQLDLDMVAYEGGGANVSPTTGYLLPIGGGWTYGPEDTHEIWVYSTTDGVITVKEALTNVAYPPP